ncbi:hypothetical protein GE061_014031 [Apolygus lucorum]|uniref:NADP-dependent oxidoreductase domain-containing protein n=1 Tax=Apolygus lucorum TaxID=248454 RepID=A0A8S9XQQ0_APOLU|nr:hypothetical protein GE061_014031 [Apolygus lucorum]
MKMPILGLGTFQGTNEEVEISVDAALAAGYRHIDTANSYGNEEGIGRVLKKWFDSGKLKREDVFIVTKCNPTHFRPEHIEKSMDQSLQKLGLSYVDLYLAHNPVGFAYKEVGYPIVDGKIQVDMNTDLAANWKVMESLVDKGKAKSIGVSNFTLSQVKRILDVARIKPTNNQVELYVYLQQPELVQFCKDNDVIVCAYGPIGSPNLEKFRKDRGMSTEGMNIQHPMTDPVVLEIAKKHGKTAAQVLLRFLIQYGVAAIPKSSSAERLRQNADIFDFELSDEEFNRLKSLDKGPAGRQFGGTSGAFADCAKHPEYSLF